jgi:hypothetical protein
MAEAMQIKAATQVTVVSLLYLPTRDKSCALVSLEGSNLFIVYLELVQTRTKLFENFLKYFLSIGIDI